MESFPKPTRGGGGEEVAGWDKSQSGFSTLSPRTAAELEMKQGKPRGAFHVH